MSLNRLLYKESISWNQGCHNPATGSIKTEYYDVHAIRCILLQENDEEIDEAYILLSLAMHKIFNAEAKFSMVEKDAYAVIEAVQNWKPSPQIRLLSTGAGLLSEKKKTNVNRVPNLGIKSSGAVVGSILIDGTAGEVLISYVCCMQFNAF